MGISATELRIGNLVDLYGSIATVQRFDFNDRPPNGLAVDKGKPIPITPERLERAGFEPNGKNRWMMTGILFDIVFNSISDPEFIGRSEGYYLLKAGIILNDIAIEYIHHFQNTIKDLTGKELEIK